QIGGLVACVVLEICDLNALLKPESLMDWKQIALIAEACLPVCWLFFALTFSRQGGWRGISISARLLVLCSSVFILVTFLPLTWL
ncbi:MAG: hypothetical protein B6I37_09300, partial [Desulfobacteraceae bacterium 4572_35.2]